MVCDAPGHVDGDLERLDERDVPEMMALVELTQPGPFGPHTRELGNYFGIRDNGRLVAMAGERLRIDGYTEISAVCTRPFAFTNDWDFERARRWRCLS